jgi:acetyl-CoA C-acetyltransferase
MVEALRADPGSNGLVWANGGYLTKQSFGVYSTDPPNDGFRHVHPQDEIDALPSRELAADHVGPATIESWVVMHDRDSRPEVAFLSLLTDDGRRAWGTTSDPAALATMVAEDMIDRRVERAADGTVTLV